LSGGEPRRPWLHRVGWLALLWMAGVAAVAITAFAIRALMLAAGLTAG
jgi:hypothetical protein